MLCNDNGSNENFISLSEIIKGIQHSVNTGQEILERHYIKTIERFFLKNGRPISKKIQIDSGRYVEVPLITLINPNALYLKELDVEMSLRIDEICTNNLETCNNSDNIKTCDLKVSIVPPREEGKEKESNIMDIRLKFRSSETPEGVSRVLDEFISVITPSINKAGNRQNSGYNNIFE